MITYENQLDNFSVFKIFSIEDDEFTEKFNLRVGRNKNLNFSAADVAWNHIDGLYIVVDNSNCSVVVSRHMNISYWLI